MTKLLGPYFVIGVAKEGKVVPQPQIQDFERVLDLICK